MLDEAREQVKKLRSELNSKNRTLNEVREDAKGNAILKIKLGMKVQAQTGIIDKLQEQITKLRDKIKDANPDLLDDDDLEEVDIEVQSCSVRPSALGGAYDEVEEFGEDLDDDLPKNEDIKDVSDADDQQRSPLSNTLKVPRGTSLTMASKKSNSPGPSRGSPSPPKRKQMTITVQEVYTPDQKGSKESPRRQTRKQIDDKKDSSKDASKSPSKNPLPQSLLTAVVAGLI